MMMYKCIAIMSFVAISVSWCAGCSSSGGTQQGQDVPAAVQAGPAPVFDIPLKLDIRERSLDTGTVSLDVGVSSGIDLRGDVFLKVTPRGDTVLDADDAARLAGLKMDGGLRSRTRAVRLKGSRPAADFSAIYMDNGISVEVRGSYPDDGGGASADGPERYNAIEPLPAPIDVSGEPVVRGVRVK